MKITVIQRDGLALPLLDGGTMPSRVLVVEDDPNTLSGYVEFLTAAGFEAIGIADGADAWPHAVSDPPDAVVTDITLPGMNGFALAVALRADPRTRSVPIIGLTAHWDTEVHLRARDVEMRVILSKPCVPAHLVAELRRLLGHALDDDGTPRANLMALSTPI